MRYVPSKTMSPISGRSCPHTQLNNVVLPAPFGPTRPTHSPADTSNVMLETAWMPPNDLQTPRRLRRGAASAIGVPGREGATLEFLRAAAEEQSLEAIVPAPLLVFEDPFGVGRVGQRAEGEERHGQA